jgi:hypothetical protein
MHYKLGKRTVSQYIRSQCMRRLRLDLIADSSVRESEQAPEKDSARPGFALLTEMGRSYEREKYGEIVDLFGDRVVHGEVKEFEPDEDTAFEKILLADVIKDAVEGHLLIEAEYPVTKTFEAAHQLQNIDVGRPVTLAFLNVRPDIIQVVGPAPSRRIIKPDGEIEKIPHDDKRLGLKVIDIKISGQPSPAHFSELAYYCMTLAGWLEDNGHCDDFVVLAEAAIWPGKHEESAIVKQAIEDRKHHVGIPELHLYYKALSRDLVTMPPEVVVGRVRRFLSHDLLEALRPENWMSLPWHVDSACSGCDYLGFRWQENSESDENEPPAKAKKDKFKENYCWPRAESEHHLSRIPGLTEAAASKLRENRIADITGLATTGAGSCIFESHQTLKAKRTVLLERAVAMRDATVAHVPDRAGTSAVLPRYPDIRVAVSADFDVGSGFTFVFGYRIEFFVPTAVDNKETEWTIRSKPRELVVQNPDMKTEANILSCWLDFMAGDVLDAAREIEEGYQRIGRAKKPTIQFYPWDKLTFEHLRRVMTRHMQSVVIKSAAGNRDLMAWLFPAEQILQDADFISQNSPVSILGDAIDSILATRVPHRHTLVAIANELDHDKRTRDGKHWSFRVNKFYQDPLSDQIPSERGQEIWLEKSPFGKMDFQQHREK